MAKRKKKVVRQRRKRSMEMPNYSPEESFVQKRAFYVLDNLKRCRIIFNSEYNSFYRMMRTMYVPRDTEDFYSDADSLGGIAYRSHSPEPHALVRKALSYQLSYLYSPSERFFVAKTQDLATQKKDNLQVDRIQFLENLTKDNHTIYQAHINFYNQAMVLRDRLIFGHGMKVIEEDATNISLYKHILPENIILASTTGASNDIVGYVVEKDDLNRELSLGEPLFVKEGFMRPTVDWSDELLVSNNRNESYGYDEYDEGASVTGTGMTGRPNYYRFNIPYKVFKLMVFSGQEWKDKTAREKARCERIFKGLFYKPQIPTLTKEDTGILDVFCSDQEVFVPTVRRTKNIIFSGFFLGEKVTSITSGFGKETQGLMLAFAEIFLQNIDAYQRMNLPPYVFFGEDQDYSANVGPNGIIFAKTDESGVAPQVLSYPGNLDGMIKFWDHMIRQMRVAWHIDDFELIKQTHMTEEEIDIRGNEGYRGLTVYAVQDAYQELNPTVLCNTNNLYANSESKEMFRNLLLDIRYQSPLTNAQKNSFIKSVDVMLNMMNKYSLSKKQFPDAMMSFDDDSVSRQIVDNLGIADVLKTTKNLRRSMAIRAREKSLMQQIALLKAQRGGRGGGGAVDPSAGGGGQGGGGGTPQESSTAGTNRGGPTQTAV